MLLVSTAGDPAVKVDIINGLSGYEFSRLRLTASVGSTVVWTNRLLIADLSFLLNHPAIIYLAKTDVGYKHGGRLHQGDGRANMLFMDAHVDGRSLKQTNGIVMEFKK